MGTLEGLINFYFPIEGRRYSFNIMSTLKEQKYNRVISQACLFVGLPCNIKIICSSIIHTSPVVWGLGCRALVAVKLYMAQLLFLGQAECLELWHLIDGNSSSAESISDVITVSQDYESAQPACKQLVVKCIACYCAANT